MLPGIPWEDLAAMLLMLRRPPEHPVGRPTTSPPNSLKWNLGATSVPNLHEWKLGGDPTVQSCIGKPSQPIVPVRPPLSFFVLVLIKGRSCRHVLVFDVCIHKMTQSDTYLLTVNTTHSIGAKQRHLQLSTL